jgi:hypothetical protein
MITPVRSQSFEQFEQLDGAYPAVHRPPRYDAIDGTPKPRMWGRGGLSTRQTQRYCNRAQVKK